MRIVPLVLLAACALPVFGQLTPDQKISDFNDLVAVFDKNYGPYEWKRDALKFDLLQTKPWLARINATTNDLDFYEVMVEFVASLNDAHDNFKLPSTFLASLPLSVDIYDGKVLIDSISRSLLPVDKYPFQIGDELVSVDGTGVQDLIQRFAKYSISANPRSTARSAANRIVSRPQNRMPHAVDLGESASLVIQGQTGSPQTYAITWQKSGLPMRTVGPVPNPGSAPPVSAELTPNPIEGQPDYMAPLRALQNCRIPDTRTILGFGSRSPIFSLPAGFKMRLGTRPTDYFISGTFTAGPYTVGFIRISDYSPANSSIALSQFLGEILYFQQATDGLVIDEMRNPGGSVLYVNQLAQLLIPNRFRSIPFEIRASSGWVESFSSSLTSAKAQNAPQNTIDQIQVILNELKQANSENRGRTGPLPLSFSAIDLDPFTDQDGNPLAYTKPLMVLIDEFSASGGDAFPATIQDNQRGPLFGMRTMGAGGNVSAYPVGSYAEGSTTLTESLMVRKNPTVTSDYPAAPYVENIGVRPDILYDYMTRDNLMQSGRPFVAAFTAAIADWIAKSN